MSFSDGLTPGELALLVSGGVFFVGLFIVFLGKAIAGKPVAVLLPFFAIPVVMMGFPTITAVKIGQEGVDIQNQTNALQSNPNDKATRESLEASVRDLKSRSFRNPEIVANIAKAELALGHNADATVDFEREKQLRARQPSPAVAATAGPHDPGKSSASKLPAGKPTHASHGKR